MAEEEENHTLDFDQFWGEYTQTPEGATTERVKILGKYYTLTVDVPMSLLVQSMSMDSKDIKGMSDLIDRLFGEGTLSAWLEKGMTLKQLPIICAWTIARIQGRKLSFADCASQLEEFMGGKEQISSESTGPPLNRATRRNMGKALKKSVK